jgi:hypothetical protein
MPSLTRTISRSLGAVASAAREIPGVAPVLVAHERAHAPDLRPPGRGVGLGELELGAQLPEITGYQAVVDITDPEKLGDDRVVSTRCWTGRGPQTGVMRGDARSAALRGIVADLLGTARPGARPAGVLGRPDGVVAWASAAGAAGLDAALRRWTGAPSSSPGHAPVG